MKIEEEDRYIVTMTAKEFVKIVTEAIHVNQASKEFPTDNSMSLDQLISRVKLAKHFNVTPKTIDKWAKYKELPKPIKIGGRKYFKICEINENHTK